MLIKDGNKPDAMSDGHRTYSGNDFSTRHWHFGKKSEAVLNGTCLKCVYGEGEHEETCIFAAPMRISEGIILTQELKYPPKDYDVRGWEKEYQWEKK